MNKQIEFDYEKDSKERMPWEHYTEQLAQADPEEISARLQIPYDRENKTFTLVFMGSTYHIAFPDFTVSHEEDSIGYYPLEEMHYAKILVIRYLLEGKITLFTGSFHTYREMPWGEVYYKQFQGRCILRLAYGFGSKIKKFTEVLERMKAKKLNFGDCSFEVELLENLYVRYILWEGDEEFPPSAQILFSDNFPSSFSAEDMAVVGDVTIGTFKAIEKIL